MAEQHGLRAGFKVRRLSHSFRATISQCGSVGLLSAAVLMAGLLAGCAGEAEDEISRETVPVSFSMTLKGEPIPDAVVVFHPVEAVVDDQPAVTPRGIVGSDGAVRVTTYRGGDGAPPGLYRLSVSWQGPLEGLDEDAIDDLKERMPVALRSPETSGLEVAISSDGPNTLPPFNL